MRCISTNRLRKAVMNKGRQSLHRTAVDIGQYVYLLLLVLLMCLAINKLLTQFSETAYK